MIPVARPDIGPRRSRPSPRSSSSGMLAQGRKVAELEERWAEFVGVAATRSR